MMTLDYLNLMGIQTWRSTLPNASLPYEIFSLQRGGVQVGSLWFETGEYVLSQQKEVMHLLDAMLAAVQLQRQSLVREKLWATGSLHLIMGEKLAQQLLASTLPLTELRAKNFHAGVEKSRILVTYHPLVLLHQPEEKAKAWQDLRKLFS